MKNHIIFILIVSLLAANIFVSYADTKQDIDKANKKGNVVFLVVTEKGGSQNKEALSIAQKAQKSVSKSSVLELDRSNSANSALIQKYRLAGAPSPLILIIAANGYVAGGSTMQNLSVESLIKLVPTPKEEVVIKGINEGKSVFLVFSKKSDSKNNKQLAACQSACQSMSNKAVTVNVDIDDKKEKSLTAKFNIDKNAAFPITYVVNAQGQVTSMLNGITEPKSLVAAAQMKVSSGCCPSGSGKSCGPAKK